MRSSGVPFPRCPGLDYGGMTDKTSKTRPCVIFGAGEYYDETPRIPHNAFIVAADGGLDHTRELGLSADVIVGDFDSLRGGMPAACERTIALPPEKDDPDMLSALKIGWAHGSRTFHIYGALGGRIDHTISNIQLMTLLARHGGIGFLHGDGTIITAICDGELVFPENDVRPGRMVSVFSHSDVSTGVSESGLKYELTDATMSNTRVNGVSNEFLDGKPAGIRVGHGTLIITFPAEAPLPAVAWEHGFTGDLGELDTEVSQALRTGHRASQRP